MPNFRARREKSRKTNVSLTPPNLLDPLLKGLFNREFAIIAKENLRVIVASKEENTHKKARAVSQQVWQEPGREPAAMIFAPVLS